MAIRRDRCKGYRGDDSTPLRPTLAGSWWTHRSDRGRVLRERRGQAYAATDRVPGRVSPAAERWLPEVTCFEHVTDLLILQQRHPGQRCCLRLPEHACRRACHQPG